MDNKSVLSILKNVVRENRARFTALILICLLGVLASLAPPQIMRVIIDRYLTAENASKLYVPALVYLAVTILIGALDFFRGYLLTLLGQRSIRRLRCSMMNKLSYLPSAYFTEHASGTTASRIMTDVESVDVLFSDGIISMAVDCLKLIGIIVSIWLFSVRLALVSLCLIPIIFFITRWFRKRMLKAQTENLEQLGKVNTRISETFRNVAMIKLASKEGYFERKFCTELEENYKTRGKVIIYDSVYAPLIQIIRAVFISIVVILASDGIDALSISVGMVAASIDLISNMLIPVESLGMEIQNIQEGLSGVKRIDAFLALPEESKDASITADAVISGFGESAVRLENLCFSYDEDTQVLRCMDLAVHTGENVTIAGRTGVGKSTMFGLIMGFLTPVEGRVLIGGRDASKIPDSEKRRIFGYVEQSFLFVPGTVTDQISLGDTAVTREMVTTACTEVGLSEAILALPDGYDTVVSSGGTFSWGQRQLLSIARAIVLKPPILLFDEITANLDSETEAEIMRTVSDISRGRTVLTVSHRESAMRGCDRLVLVEDGMITAEGKPEELLQ